MERAAEPARGGEGKELPGHGRTAQLPQAEHWPWVPLHATVNPTLLETSFLLPQVLAPEGSLGPPAERRSLPSLAFCSAARQEAHMVRVIVRKLCPCCMKMQSQAHLSSFPPRDVELSHNILFI